MSKLLLVATATPTQDDALTLAKQLVGTRLAASAQITAATTVFWHLGQLGTGEEWRIELTTSQDSLAALEAELISQHPWDNPQLTVTEVAHTTAAYERWLHESTSTSS